MIPRRAPLLAPALGVLAGAALGAGTLPVGAWLALAALSLSAAASLRVRAGAAWILLGMAGVAAGGLRAEGALRAHAAAVCAEGLSDGTPADLRAVVLDRLDEVRSARLRLGLLSGPELRMTCEPEAPGRPGDLVRIEGLFRAPRPAGNPGGFDGPAWCLRQGIAGSVSGTLTVLGEAPGTPAALRRLRGRLGRRLRARVPGEPGTLLEALLLGIREPLDETLSDAFLETGTVHFLAISGTHILLLLGGLAWILRRLPLGLRTRAAVLAAAAAAYTLLVGCQAPILRAALGAALACLGVLLDRPRAAANALCAAALAIVLADPGQVVRPGFQLSFLAVAGILAASRPLASRWEPRLGRFLAGALSVGLCAWLSVLPLVAFHFHLVTPVVLLANLLVFPLISAGMGLGVLAFALPAGAAAPFAWAASRLLELLAASVKALAAVPGGHAYVGDLPAGLLASAYALLILLAWTVRGGAGAPRPRTVLLLALPWALAWGLWTPPLATPGSRIALLDLRHGMGVLVQVRGGRTLLYDCGSYRDPEAGARALAPALWALGVRRIDDLVVSHAHDDHVNALPALARRFPVGRVLAPEAVLGSRAWTAVEPLRGRLPLRGLEAGDALDLGGGIRARLLHPPARMEAPPNELSACLLLSFPARGARARAWRTGESGDLPAPGGTLRVLLTGDLEDGGAAALLAGDPLPECGILLLPHHGAPLGPAAELLDAVRPVEAWASAREGFPSPRVLEAARVRGIRVRETWRDGAVLLDILDAP